MSTSLLRSFSFFLLLFHFSLSLEIQVFNGTELLRTYEDSSAYSDGRSSLIYEVEALLYYPVPRNACSTIENDPMNESDNNYYVAYVPNYDACPGTNIRMLQDSSSFSIMLTYSPSAATLSERDFDTIIIDDKSFADYLENLLDSSPPGSITLIFTEDLWGLYEKIILIMCMVLMCAISLAICIFLCTYCTRWSWYKWRQRGLTRWRIRQLPQRRYKPDKETTQTCPICLEDFKEGEKLRVLPCDHIFHPPCVDEWLQKWQRVCPLCKSLISRRRERRRERSPLLQNEGGGGEEEPGTNGRRGTYGSIGGDDPPEVEVSQEREREGEREEESEENELNT